MHRAWSRLPRLLAVHNTVQLIPGVPRRSSQLPLHRDLQSTDTSIRACTSVSMESTAKRAKSETLEDPLARCRGDAQVLILDGGLATHIEALGEDIDNSLWSARCLVKNPDIIKRAHGDFYAAGASVAITASYQAHFDGFRELGVDETEAVAAMKLSVTLAREAAREGALVAG